MNKLTFLPLFRACCVISGLFFAAGSPLKAQSTETPASKSIPVDEPTVAEMINSYRVMREQLQATQFAIAANRLEAEANARVQAAIGDKLESIRTTMELERERHLIDTDRVNAERDRQRVEIERVNAERDRQQAEIQRFTQMVFWIALGFGGVGLIAVIIVPLVQWRALKRLAEIRSEHLALPAAPAAAGLLENGALAAGDDTVAHSNRRLLSVIDRMEQRIFELEQTAAHPLPPASANPFVPADPNRRLPAVSAHAERISTFMSRGRNALEAGKAREALTCFDEILKLDLNHAEALIRRGAALEQLKQDDEALQCYDRAIKIDPKLTLAYLHKGGLCNRLQRYEESLQCYEQALRTEEEEKQNSGSHSPVPGPWPASGRTLSAG